MNENDQKLSSSVQNKELSEEARAKRSEYLREWRKRNKEKCAAYRRKYWEKKAAGS